MKKIQPLKVIMDDKFSLIPKEIIFADWRQFFGRLVGFEIHAIWEMAPSREIVANCAFWSAFTGQTHEDLGGQGRL